MSQVKSHSLLTDYDIHLFRQGNHYKLYEKLGSHIVQVDGEWGTHFAVWAPNATRLSVIGEFNDWDRKAHPLTARPDGSGIWEGFIPGVGKGKLYKYYLRAADGRHLEKGDPFALFWEVPPNTASIVWEFDYDWKDDEYLRARKAKFAAGGEQPYSVYEVHPGSWKKHPNGDSLSYRELATELVDYVEQTGFTHVEFMPVMEHPYYPSWGYQVTGYFAPTSRYGLPEDFMFLVDALHAADIGVILDWVPSHFPNDAHGLADFDGTHLYDHADPRKGFHPDWKSCIFNYGRHEVRSFLISNALWWADRYHADGLRVDAVASMLYLDYSREEGQWIPNKYGGNENLEAISFLQEFNAALKEAHPDVVTIAEESTSYAGVSKPVADGGLGFDQKWMMGWMHDTLKYFAHNPIYRRYHHNEITFSLVYAFSERFMLPLSHDEVVHGKGPIHDKMPGDKWQRFANLRLLYSYMYTHPGTKLNFMGNEIGQTTEWSTEKGVDWALLDKKKHAGIHRLFTDLNTLYRERPALYARQFDNGGFEWIEHADYETSTLAYQRNGGEKDKPLLVVANFTPVLRDDYRLGLPVPGTYREVFNSDDEKYGGSGQVNTDTLKPEKTPWHYRDQSLVITVPPLGITVLELVRKAPVRKKAATKAKPAAEK